MFRRLLCRCKQEACRGLIKRDYKRKVPVRMYGPGSFFRDPHWLENWFREPRGLPRYTAWLEKEMSDMIKDGGEFMRRFGGPFSSGFYGMLDPNIEVNYNENDYKVSLDVSDFSPEELTLKIIDDTITITGKHDQKEDHHGTVSREFTRQILVPEDVDPDSIRCTVTPEGIMKVMGKVKAEPRINDREIKIEREAPETETGKKEDEK